MDSLKKHYEKVVLGLVLLALAVVAILLFVQVGTFKTNLDDQLKNRTGVKKKELTSVDLSTNQAVLRRLASSIQVPLGGEHPIFTATRWRKTANNDVAPDTSKLHQGPAAISAVVTTPLYLSIEYIKNAGTPDSPRYEFLIGREFEKQANKRGNLTLSARVGEGVRLSGPGQKTDLFRLLEIKGPPEEPTELTIQLTAGNERATIATKRPYRQIMGYAAQFGYGRGAEKRGYRNVRVDDSLPLSGTTYKVVSISDSDLVISAPNQVRTTIKAGVTE